MEDGISVHWWYRNSDPDKIGINGSVKIISTDGEELHKFNPDFGQKIAIEFCGGLTPHPSVKIYNQLKI